MRIVGGKWRGKKLLAPTHIATRPTSDRTRETIFNILLHNPNFGSSVVQDKNVLDLFAGTGALGLEALSRGAKTVTFVENNRDALKVLYMNISTFDLQTRCVLEQDATTFISSHTFDLVFMDPPYHKNHVLLSLEHLLNARLLAKGAVVVVEMAKEESLQLPDHFELVKECVSGVAKLLFLVAK